MLSSNSPNKEAQVLGNGINVASIEAIQFIFSDKKNQKELMDLTIALSKLSNKHAGGRIQTRMKVISSIILRMVEISEQVEKSDSLDSLYQTLKLFWDQHDLMIEEIAQFKTYITVLSEREEEPVLTTVLQHYINLANNCFNPIEARLFEKISRHPFFIFDPHEKALKVELADPTQVTELINFCKMDRSAPIFTNVISEEKEESYPPIHAVQEHSYDIIRFFYKQLLDNAEYYVNDSRHLEQLLDFCEPYFVEDQAKICADVIEMITSPNSMASFKETHDKLKNDFPMVHNFLQQLMEKYPDVRGHFLKDVSQHKKLQQEMQHCMNARVDLSPWIKEHTQKIKDICALLRCIFESKEIDFTQPPPKSLPAVLRKQVTQWQDVVNEMEWFVLWAGNDKTVEKELKSLRESVEKFDARYDGTLKQTLHRLFFTCIYKIWPPNTAMPIPSLAVKRIYSLYKNTPELLLPDYENSMVWSDTYKNLENGKQKAQEAYFYDRSLLDKVMVDKIKAQSELIHNLQIFLEAEANFYARQFEKGEEEKGAAFDDLRYQAYISLVALFGRLHHRVTCAIQEIRRVLHAPGPADEQEMKSLRLLEYFLKNTNAHEKEDFILSLLQGLTQDLRSLTLKNFLQRVNYFSVLLSCQDADWQRMVKKPDWDYLLTPLWEYCRSFAIKYKLSKQTLAKVDDPILRLGSPYMLSELLMARIDEVHLEEDTFFAWFKAIYQVKSDFYAIIAEKNAVSLKFLDYFQRATQDINLGRDLPRPITFNEFFNAAHASNIQQRLRQKIVKKGVVALTAKELVLAVYFGESQHKAEAYRVALSRCDSKQGVDLIFSTILEEDAITNRSHFHPERSIALQQALGIKKLDMKEVHEEVSQSYLSSLLSVLRLKHTANASAGVVQGYSRRFLSLLGVHGAEEEQKEEKSDDTAEKDFIKFCAYLAANRPLKEMQEMLLSSPCLANAIHENKNNQKDIIHALLMRQPSLVVKDKDGRMCKSGWNPKAQFFYQAYNMKNEADAEFVHWLKFSLQFPDLTHACLEACNDEESILYHKNKKVLVEDRGQLKNSAMVQEITLEVIEGYRKRSSLLGNLMFIEEAKLPSKFIISLAKDLRENSDEKLNSAVRTLSQEYFEILEILIGQAHDNERDISAISLILQRIWFSFNFTAEMAEKFAHHGLADIEKSKARINFMGDFSWEAIESLVIEFIRAECIREGMSAQRLKLIKSEIIANLTQTKEEDGKLVPKAIIQQLTNLVDGRLQSLIPEEKYEQSLTNFYGVYIGLQRLVDKLKNLQVLDEHDWKVLANSNDVYYQLFLNLDKASRNALDKKLVEMLQPAALKLSGLCVEDKVIDRLIRIRVMLNQFCRGENGVLGLAQLNEQDQADKRDVNHVDFRERYLSIHKANNAVNRLLVKDYKEDGEQKQLIKDAYSADKDAIPHVQFLILAANFPKRTVAELVRIINQTQPLHQPITPQQWGFNTPDQPMMIGALPKPFLNELAFFKGIIRPIPFAVEKLWLDQLRYRLLEPNSKNNIPLISIKETIVKLFLSQNPSVRFGVMHLMCSMEESLQNMNLSPEQEDLIDDVIDFVKDHFPGNILQTMQSELDQVILADAFTVSQANAKPQVDSRVLHELLAKKEYAPELEQSKESMIHGFLHQLVKRCLSKQKEDMAFRQDLEHLIEGQKNIGQQAQFTLTLLIELKAIYGMRLGELSAIPFSLFAPQKVVSAKSMVTVVNIKKVIDLLLARKYEQAKDLLDRTVEIVPPEKVAQARVYELLTKQQVQFGP